MILSASTNIVEPLRILHVCGDDPESLLLGTKTVTVFSTYVEMILAYHFEIVCTYCILHVCGDDPV